MKIYRGVVEDNKDPEKMGRVRVRIMGLHTDSSDSQTQNLCWCEVMGSTAFGLIGGIGVSSILHQGTWVYLFLEDDNPNKAIVVGTVIGKVEASQGNGFKDPEGKFPKADRVGRSDVNSLIDSKYTTNQVIETESGHIIELDDSPGDERIHIHHKTGTDFLIDKDGNIKVLGVKNLDYTLNENATVHIIGNNKINIDGTNDVTVKGNNTVNIDSNNSITVKGNNTLKVQGNLDYTVQGSCNIKSSGPMTLKGSPLSLN